MEIKDDEKMELDGMEFSEDLLFYGSPLKLGELVKLAGKCIGEVEGSNNVRLIVLETWLFIDFCIRELLMSGLGLNSVNIDTCDLRSQLLPISFSRCIELIEKLYPTERDGKCYSRIIKYMLENPFYKGIINYKNNEVKNKSLALF